jgi:hypothetical protein
MARMKDTEGAVGVARAERRPLKGISGVETVLGKAGEDNRLLSRRSGRLGLRFWEVRVHRRYITFNVS